MITAEKAKKRIRKNYKDRIRTAYKQIKFKAELTIENAIESNCYIEVRPELRLATFIVKKKLEDKGFVCELREDDYRTGGIFHNDRLFIYWEK